MARRRGLSWSFMRAATLCVAAVAALVAVGQPAVAGGSAPARQASIEIVSPAAETSIAGPRLEVVVEFRATGNFHGLALQVNDAEVARRLNPPARKAGTERFTVDLAGMPDGPLTLRAIAWQGNERADLQVWSAPITVTLRGAPSIDTLIVASFPDERSRAVGTFGPFGGILETDDSSGTHYELSIPPGALPSDEVISFAPTVITGLEGVATSTRHAVDFAPAGLSFAVPLTLTITPPAGSGVPPDTLYGSWGGSPGLELGVPRLDADGTIEIPVWHFSGVATLQATAQSYDNMLTLALVASAGISGAAANQLNTLVDGLPGSAAAVAQLVMQLHDSVVAPALAHAGDGLVELRVAASRLKQFGILFQLHPEIDGLPVTSQPAATLGGVRATAEDAFVDAATALLAKHLAPACSATVAGLADWFIVPLSAAAELADYGPTPPLNFCAAAALEPGPFPTSIDASVQFVSGSFRGVVRAPAQTPGGESSGGVAVFAQPTAYSLSATYGAFSGGVAALAGTSGADGQVAFQIDRGPDPRPPNVGVSGSATVGGFWVQVEQALGLAAEFPVAFAAGPPSATRIAFRNPPVDRYLPWSGLPGGSPTGLCVDVVDAEDNALVGATVEWSLDGPGSLAAATSTTSGLGVACADYVHSDGPVVEGITATVTASATVNGATGTASVTLLPSWVRIELAVRPDSGADFQLATNSAVIMGPVEGAQINVIVTANGVAPGDPPVMLLDVVGVEITLGGGRLLDALGDLVELSFAMDAPGFTTLRFDPDGSSGDTQLRFFNPAVGAGVAATVTLDRTPPPSVTLTPLRPSLAVGQTRRFTATVLNLADPTVTWHAPGGTIDPSGLFTAGSTAGVFSVTARSAAAPTVSATTLVEVTATASIVGRYTGMCQRLDAGPNLEPEATPPGYAHFIDDTAVAGRFALLMPPIANTCGALVSWPGCLWVLPSGLETTGGTFAVSAPSAALGSTCSGPYATQTRIDGSLADGSLEVTMYFIYDDGGVLPVRRWTLVKSF